MVVKGTEAAWRWELGWRRSNSGAASKSENRSLSTRGADSWLFKCAPSPKISAVDEAFCMARGPSGLPGSSKLARVGVHAVRPGWRGNDGMISTYLSLLGEGLVWCSQMRAGWVEWGVDVLGIVG